MSNMVVRTNIYALNSHRNMKNVGLQQKQASNRLSSGYRINSAADDAAGLAISETMRSQIRGLDQASRNAQDGQAMLLTTEGGLEEIGNMLQRTRELMVQASNDTNTQNQRAMIDQEIRQLGQEIASMQRRVEFNTNRVLDMGPTMTAAVTDEIAAMYADNVTLDEAMKELAKEKANVNQAMELLNGVTPSDKVTATSATVQAAVTKALGSAVTISTAVAALKTTGANATGKAANLAATVSTAVTLAAGTTASQALTALNNRMSAIDKAVASINSAKMNIMSTAKTQAADIQKFATATSTEDKIAFFQVGANSNQGITYDFEKVARAVTSAASTVQMLGALVGLPGEGSGIGNGIDISPFINSVQNSLDNISNVRANLGAVQNRMDYTMRSLDISSENLSDSESRVRNADIAKEMMKFTMSNVLQQAAVSMLSQANQMPNNLLQLLR